MGGDRRTTRTLKDCTVTYHAVDSYLRRVPGGTPERAREEIADLMSAARFCGTDPTGEEIWRVKAGEKNLRLVVHRIARRPPMLLTVMYQRPAGRCRREEP